MSTPVDVERGQSAPPQDPQHPRGGGDNGDSGHGHGDDELPHLPPPSIRPLVMSIGLLIACYGLVYVARATWVGLAMLVGGIALFGFGLGGWIYDDVKATRAGGHGHH